MSYIPSDKKTSASNDGSSPKVRVMIVDDSLVVRGIIRKILIVDHEVEVVAAVGNGKLAVEKLDSTEVDAVILDLEMPVMDGLTAIPLMLKKKPDLVILVASTLSQKNADVSIKCMTLGAKDYVPKPTTSNLAGNGDAFKVELLGKLKAITRAFRNRGSGRVPARRAYSPAPSRQGAKKETARGATSAAQDKPASDTNELLLRPLMTKRPRALVIGCSTGGPQALAEFFKEAASALTVPVFVVQHMPPLFTKSLAQHLAKVSGLPCAEAQDGERVENKKIYVAPGDYHMQVQSEGLYHKIKLTQEAPENYCRPSVNPTLRSAARAYGGAALGVMLTGLGSDGLQGAKELIQAGGSVLAQDERTSIVWGMPGAVANAGLASAVLPLTKMFHAAQQVLNAVNPSLGVRFS